MEETIIDDNGLNLENNSFDVEPNPFFGTDTVMNVDSTGLESLLNPSIFDTPPVDSPIGPGDDGLTKPETETDILKKPGITEVGHCGNMCLYNTGYEHTRFNCGWTH